MAGDVELNLLYGELVVCQGCVKCVNYLSYIES